MNKIEAILNQKEFTFSDVYNYLKNLQQIISENPNDVSLYLPAFYHIYNDKLSHSSDLRPSLCSTYATIISQLSLSEIKKSFNKLTSEGNNWIIARCTGDILKSRPELSDLLYEQMKIDAQNINTNNQFGYASALRSIIIASDNEYALKILNESLTLFPAIQKSIIKDLLTIYKQKPDISENIWNIIISNTIDDASDLSTLYDNLSQICSITPDKISDSLAIIEKNISSSQNDSASLKIAYKSLENMRSHKEHQSKVDNIITLGLTNPQNNKESSKKAHRILGNYEQLCSSISIGQRTEKDENNPMGWKNIDTIPATEACVLFLGGDGTTSDKTANGYLKSVEQLLQKEQVIEGISLYSVVYDFGTWDDRDIVFNGNKARTQLMQQYKHNIKMESSLNDDTINPRYIKKIFDTAFLPRISDKNGRRLTTEEATQNIRKLNIIAHCHGAYTFLKLEEMMQTKMEELGYSNTEQQKIQKQLLCVAHAPYCPLGASKSTLISFCSAQDEEVSHYNNFQQEITKLNKQNEMKISYFPDKLGNVFVCSRMGEGVEEHNFTGYDISQKGLSSEGKAILAFAGRAIANGIRSSIRNETLPDVETLVCGEDSSYKRVFRKVEENGRAIYRRILSNSIQNHKITSQASRE